MTLTEFLLARIADDEAEAWRWNADAGTGDWDSLEERVLAECEAKRRIVGIYTHVQLGEGWDGEPAVLGGAGPETYYETLQHLAAVYADHPDYDEAWRP